MSTSPDFGLPYISGQQAQPEITHNEAISLLQALLNGVIDRGVNTPPGSPAEGDAYIVGSSPTGAWVGRENTVAVYFGTAWTFVPGADENGDPIVMGARHEGMRVYVRDEDILYAWIETGSPPAFAWTPMPYQLGAGVLAPIVEAGTALTLTAAHHDRVIYFTSGSAITVTLPQASTETLDPGFVCTLIKAGTGDVALATEGDDVLLSVAVGSPPTAIDTIAAQGGAAVVTLLAGPSGSPPGQLGHAEGRLV